MEELKTTTEIISGISAVIGLFFVGFQLHSGERLAKAQFINELARDIDSHRETESHLDREGKWYEPNEPNATFSQQDKELLEKYLNFFERVKFILDTKVIDIKTIDCLFAYRFFNLVHNPNVQQEILLSPPLRSYYESIFSLYDTWIEYRKGKDIPRKRFTLPPSIKRK
ncbi:hypothetical protein [Crocosphaera watsonii]|uniref:hypothetical protein n=1 Tax=Crocosphaera watsonii TaxID=263511 RepID=UPI000650AB2A|nr:hypothetical protein [Crocosphaera watsonii]